MSTGITSSSVPWRMAIVAGPLAMSSSRRASLSKRCVTRKPTGSPVTTRLISIVLVKGESSTPWRISNSVAAIKHAAPPKLWPKKRRRVGSRLEEKPTDSAASGTTVRKDSRMRPGLGFPSQSPYPGKSTSNHASSWGAFDASHCAQSSATVPFPPQTIHRLRGDLRLPWRNARCLPWEVVKSMWMPWVSFSQFRTMPV